MLDTPEKIERARLLTLRTMLKLETKGMSLSRAPSAYSRIKNEFNLKGSKLNVLAQFNLLLEN